MISETKPSPFRWRPFTSVLIAISFLVLVLTGIMLFVSPPGRVANWTNWTLLRLTKREWTGLHVWFSTTFLLASVVHIVFNWRPLIGYFRDRLSQRVGFRVEWVAAAAVSGLVFLGTQMAWPPFATLLTFNERVKESWESPQERAPIPHAELLTLAELAQKAGVDFATATNRLATKGIRQISADIMVQQLADRNQRSAQQLFEIMLAASGPASPGHGAGQGQGGAGGGPGRKTLSQFCADEGVELPEAIQRLEAKGIKATADQTLREIAVNNGYTRPYELLEVLRKK